MWDRTDINQDMEHRGSNGFNLELTAGGLGIERVSTSMIEVSSTLLGIKGVSTL